MPNLAEDIALARGLVETLGPAEHAVSSATKMFDEVFAGATTLSKDQPSIRESAAQASPQLLTYAEFRRQVAYSGQQAKDILGSVRAENFVGSGQTHSVYRLDGINGFLLRTKTNNLVAGQTLREVNDVWPERNIGQAVARIGNSEIIKAVPGQPIELPVNTPYWAQEGLRQQKLEMIAGMPQSAFDGLAHTFMDLPLRDLAFDRNGVGNILADHKSGVFNIVDVATHDEQYVPTSLDLVKPLTWTSRHEPWGIGLVPNFALYRNILQKSLNAIKVSHLPVEPDKEIGKLFSLTGVYKYYPIPIR